ncbi:adenylate/guanylate cyclase domain-containing protein [Salipaludibacillus sp. CF4.18]|uniref:adenylate/guanylate cyclase domain-containing protein n=1 Tax=Salipaludibacillus sp. CF4.18 TaxID=3373081 RepID=UPI003EE7DB1D
MPSVSKAKFNEIETRIERIFTTDMEVNDFTGDVVPSTQDLPDKNRGLIITNCTILFVDIRSSTKLSDKSQARNMAKIYRAFARAMSMCVYETGGRVRQIAGDRVMGVFVDDAEESSVHKAMIAAQAILTVVEYLFNPLCRKNVNNKEIGCGIGLDTGRVLTTSIGMKHQGEDSRDLVWAGKTANVASKHTDLAEANEVFVTKRFYDKLPQQLKTDTEGNPIWKKGYRVKGDSLFEGYGIHEFYLKELVEELGEETAEKRATASSSEGSTESEGIDKAQIITDIVQGVESKVGGLLSHFEQVVLREVTVSAKERQAEQKLKELSHREEAVKKKEEELKRKEQEIENIIAYKKKEVVYDVRVKALREQTDHMKLPDFLVELKEVQNLGAEIGKKAGTVDFDVSVWQIVTYLHGKDESELAFQILVGQLTQDLPSAYIPITSNSVPIIKKVGKEREYLKAALYYIEIKKPDMEKILKIRSVLKELGMEHKIVHHPGFLIE